MSGRSRNGFTWKEVADVLRVAQISDSAIVQREFKRPKKQSVGAKGPVKTNDVQRTSDRAQLRRRGASG